MKTPLYIFSIIILVLILFFVPFRILIFNESFYDYELDKLKVHEVMGKERAQNLTTQVLSYLRTGKGYLPDFNEREIRHLDDVKKLIDLYFVLGSLSILIFILICYFFWKDKLFPKIFLFSGISALAIIFIFILMVKINFNLFFNYFHMIFFKPGTWVFNPETEIIKQLFPNKFFEDFVIFHILDTALLSIISILFSIIYKKTFKQRKNRKRK